MKYAGKEVISDSEAKRFARNLCKKREKFPSFDDALSFVSTIRKVVSDSEFGRMNREHCQRLAWEVRDEDKRRPVPAYRARGRGGGESMTLPLLSAEGADRLLEKLIRVRGMDPDDAMDWLEAHCTIERDEVPR